MSQSIKVKVRPGQTIQFPAVCVNCSKPASNTMTVQRQAGRLTRLIEMPVCDVCYRELGRCSGEEERLQRLARVLAVFVFLMMPILVLLILPSGLVFLLRLLVAVALATGASLALYNFMMKKSLAAAKPEKMKILNAAKIVEFSWRATTFEFENQSFAQSFAQINEPMLMEPNGNLVEERSSDKLS